MDQLAQIRAEKARQYQLQKTAGAGVAGQHVEARNTNQPQNSLNQANNAPKLNANPQDLLQDINVSLSLYELQEATASSVQNNDVVVVPLNPIFPLRTGLHHFLTKQKIAPANVRLWRNDLLVDQQKTPNELGLVNNEKLVVEVKTADGWWPKDVEEDKKPKAPQPSKPDLKRTIDEFVKTMGAGAGTVGGADGPHSHGFIGSNNMEFGYYSNQNANPFGTLGKSDDWQMQEAMKLSMQAAEKDRKKYENLETALVSRGLRIKHMKDDGNCLFRAIADQMFGDDTLHADARALIVNYMTSAREHFIQFVTEDFDTYLVKMSCDGEYGTNLEIQALTDVACRPVEVYTDEAGAEPMNIFQGSHYGERPIRLSYHRGNHYNSVVAITSEDEVIPATSFAQYNANEKSNH